MERLGRFPGKEEIGMVIDDRAIRLVERVRALELEIIEVGECLKRAKKDRDSLVAELLALVEEQKTGQGQLGMLGVAGVVKVAEVV